MLITKTGILGRVQLQPFERQPSVLSSLLSARKLSLLRGRSASTNRVESAGQSSAASLPSNSSSLKQSVDVATCSHLSWDEELLVSGDAVHPILREGRRLVTLQRQLAASQNLSEKVVEGADRSQPAEPAQQITYCVVDRAGHHLEEHRQSAGVPRRPRVRSMSTLAAWHIVCTFCMAPIAWHWPQGTQFAQYAWHWPHGT